MVPPLHQELTKRLIKKCRDRRIRFRFDFRTLRDNTDCNSNQSHIVPAMANLLPICYLILAGVGAGLLIASFSSNYWRSYSSLLINYTEGLFKRCADFRVTELCTNIHEGNSKTPGKLAGTIALILCAILTGILSAVIKLAGSFLARKGIVAVLALQIFAVSSGVVGLLVYTNEYLQGIMKAGWSYSLAWVGVGFLGLDIVILMLSAFRR